VKLWLTQFCRATHSAYEERNRIQQILAYNHEDVCKRAKKAIESGDREAAEAAVLKAQSVIDKVAVKGVIHKNEAARRKSRLMKLFNQKFQ